MAVEITHNAGASRFECTIEGQTCVLEYRLAGKVLTITHTGVPAALGGRGIAGQLTEAAFAHVRAQGLKVVPACSYASGWVQRHPEVADLIA
jgi:predicted GNAT family acetyltransferase